MLVKRLKSLLVDLLEFSFIVSHTQALSDSIISWRVCLCVGNFDAKYLGSWAIGSWAIYRFMSNSDPI